MKKLRLALVVAMLTMITAVSAQISYSVKGGVNLSNVNLSPKEDDIAMKVGFHAGVGLDYEFMPNMAIQSGLIFTSKGAKAKEGDAKFDLMYIQLPIHYAYKIDVSPGTRVVLHAGPYVAYGVAGKYKLIEGYSLNSFGKSTVEGHDVEGFKRFDTGLGLGAGMEFGQFLVDIGWDMGLVNIAPSAPEEAVMDGFNVKNMNAYLSVGFRF